MEALQKKARALLEAGTVKVVIGYAAGSDAQRARAVFARNAEQTQQLVFDARCRQNLATYLLKNEVKAFGKAAVVCVPGALRTLMVYAVENQLADEAVLALVVTDDGQVAELPKFAAIEEYLQRLPRGLTPEQQQELDRIEKMPLEERWAYWSGELSRCLKCYACRAACPLCYCTRCVTDANQPQWVPVSSDPLGNLEWNIVRAMHLAGRCIDCGSCAEACPEDIRIDLLNRVMAREVSTHFGAEPGYSTRKEYALAAYKPDDKEEFIR
jgi:ferredoxin